MITNMPVWVLLVYALTCARLTGLITTDELTRPIRLAILTRLDERRPTHQALATLTTCQWCASIYMAAGVAPIAWWHGLNPWFLVPALALAFSQITGMASDLGRN
jgi:hypothetical protein